MENPYGMITGVQAYNRARFAPSEIYEQPLTMPSTLQQNLHSIAHRLIVSEPILRIYPHAGLQHHTQILAWMAARHFGNVSIPYTFFLKMQVQYASTEVIKETIMRILWLLETTQQMIFKLNVDHHHLLAPLLDELDSRNFAMWEEQWKLVLEVIGPLW